MKKKRRVNRAKRVVSQPRFGSKVERPAKGPGSYRRKPKHERKENHQDSEG
ncbi:MAG: alternative ribosome rescue factor ArfA [Gammaproteobacteria bacterium]|nr:alternative ribosome rescue factor ArfA [Gammaproteobacteria bacterium]MDP6616724.1 alternative ribosome rescue factor ArfA [Gammaproteobacteria bacterium]MDP6695211.1 alternative ribosome rescue factor ArfA [Gammaproteobacteria bacterium]